VDFDGFDLQYAVALDKRTGRTVWRSDRTHDFGTDDGDQKKGFATPVVIEAAGRAQLISPVLMLAAGALLALASGMLASGLGYAAWYGALRGLTATRAATVQLSVPPLAAAGGVLVLGEAPTFASSRPPS